MQGLRPETIFGCVFDFLFEPTSAAKALFRKELDKMQQKNTLKIAIQIRTSDTAMAQNGLVLDEQNSKKDALLNPYENYFACAKVWSQCICLKNLICSGTVVRSSPLLLMIKWYKLFGWHLRNCKRTINKKARTSYGSL